MIKNKIFKKFRKFEENLLNNSKLTYYAFSNHKKKKWQVFKKPFNFKNNTEDYIKISTFYKKDLLLKKKEEVCNISKTSNLNLAISLVNTKFCRTYAEAFFLIKNGKVSVNRKKTTNQLYQLIPGDLVSLNKINLQPTWMESFFFTKFKKVTTNYKFKPNYEISFSGQFFIVCFL